MAYSRNALVSAIGRQMPRENAKEGKPPMKGKGAHPKKAGMAHPKKGRK